MKIAASEPVKKGAEGDELLLGTSSWSDDDTSLKYGWLDKNGKRTRGGELPTWAIPQGVLFAAREGYLDRQQIAEIAKSVSQNLLGEERHAWWRTIPQLT